MVSDERDHVSAGAVVAHRALRVGAARYNEYIGRLQRVLQQGRPVVDIAVLYPIHGLQAAYHFGAGKP